MTDPFAAPDPSTPTAPGSGATSSYGAPAPYGTPAYGAPAPYGTPAYGAPAPYGAPPAAGPVGKVRGTGFGILMFVITFGIYGLYWYFVTHEEMKRHSGEGLGGGIALVLAIIVGVASPFLVSHEVGQLYSRRGQQPPVSALTGLWYMPGIFLLVLPIVWFVKTNGALNAYWRTQGT